MSSIGKTWSDGKGKYIDGNIIIWIHSESGERRCHLDKKGNFDEAEPTKDDISLCNNCNCMTHSIRKGRANYICGKCGHDKTLGDLLQTGYGK